MLGHEVQKGPSQRRVWVHLHLLLAPGLVKSFLLRVYICIINLSYPLPQISKYSMPVMTYQGSVAARSLSLKSSIERTPCSKGKSISGQESSVALRLLTIYGERGWNYVCITASCLGHCSRHLLTTTLPVHISICLQSSQPPGWLWFKGLRGAHLHTTFRLKKME